MTIIVMWSVRQMTTCFSHFLF